MTLIHLYGKILKNACSYVKYAMLFILLAFGCPYLYIAEFQFTISPDLTALIFVLIYAAAQWFVYTNRLLRDSSWKGCLSSALVLVGHGLVLFGQRHFWLSLTLVIAVAVFNILLFGYLLTFRKKKSVGFLKQCISVASAITAVALLITFALPAFIGIYVQADNRGFSLDELEEYADESTDGVGFFYENDPMLLHTDMLETLDKWRSLNTSQRTLVLSEVTKTELLYLGFSQEEISSINFRVEVLSENTFGCYSHEEKSICINLHYLSIETPVSEMIDTICHEAFHAYQHYIVENLDYTSPQVEHGYYYRQAREWDRNMDNYISAEFDYMLYNLQPIERDANAYANERVIAYIDALNGNE